MAGFKISEAFVAIRSPVMKRLEISSGRHSERSDCLESQFNGRGSKVMDESRPAFGGVFDARHIASW